ncbi:cysteine--tRNA ligase [Sneathiella chinensis]|uniref:Cysteine--tRNA ligase n=1 Tax=Sneathiella chinensis TaxID=349750 RepID=A0ABQ5U5A9_9PROT|nr:cysteine--tRNA ligase [Sneathiella chinensis]GLQ07028.1 cysteine--tRNA ligase [Sneathiella chinensis]
MTLHLYNTASRQKEEFVPRDPANVGMYVCGPTVYDFAHIGNARPVVIFDVLARLLRRIYGAEHVTYVRNITDVEDKIIVAAEANNESIEDLTTRTTQAFHDDMAELGALPPDREPRATQHIDGMIGMISVLIEKGHAYEAEGHVLFDVTSMPEYGALSGRNRDDMIAGARVEVAPYKKDPADFVLWKPSTDDMPGWDSPWGRGRPGWHIECSVMSKAELGDTFDIHGGGRDLIFPHHENEVAQSCCANGKGTFARYWVHNGFLTVEGDKMSKSLGNFRTVRELLAEAPGEALRLNMLSAQYRQPLDWTADGVRQARTNLDRLYTAVQHLSDVEAAPDAFAAEVLDALEDDLNTPKALTALYAYASEANKATDPAARAMLKAKLLSGGGLLGLLQQDPDVWFKGGSEGEIDAEAIEALIQERLDARKNKNYARSDEIRDMLKDQGVILEDGPQGTTWKRA